LYKSQKSEKEILAMIRQAFAEESFAVHGMSKLVETRKTRKATGKIKSMFFDIKGFFTNKSSWQAKQSIPHTTVKFYGD
jgi:hypothetical protein